MVTRIATVIPAQAANKTKIIIGPTMGSPAFNAILNNCPHATSESSISKNSYNFIQNVILIETYVNVRVTVPTNADMKQCVIYNSKCIQSYE